MFKQGESTILSVTAFTKKVAGIEYLYMDAGFTIPSKLDDILKSIEGRVKSVHENRGTDENLAQDLSNLAKLVSDTLVSLQNERIKQMESRREAFLRRHAKDYAELMLIFDPKYDSGFSIEDIQGVPFPSENDILTIRKSLKMPRFIDTPLYPVVREWPIEERPFDSVFIIRRIKHFRQLQLLKYLIYHPEGSILSPVLAGVMKSREDIRSMIKLRNLYLDSRQGEFLYPNSREQYSIEELQILMEFSPVREGEIDALRQRFFTLVDSSKGFLDMDMLFDDEPFVIMKVFAFILFDERGTEYFPDLYKAIMSFIERKENNKKITLDDLLDAMEKSNRKK